MIEFDRVQTKKHNTGHWTQNTNYLKAGNQKSESEIRNQKSDIRNQKSEIRNQKSDICLFNAFINYIEEGGRK